MRPARTIATVVFVAAIAVTGCSAHPSPAPHLPGTAPPLNPGPTNTPQPGPGLETPPSTNGPPVDRPAIGRCAASALRGSNQGSDGAAGTIWFTIQLRNASARTCTVKGSPGVRLLSAQGQPLLASTPVRLDGGSQVTLRPGRAARLVFSSPHACDSFVMASRIRVTLSHGQGSLVVPLGEDLDACRHLYVQPLEPATA